MTGGTGPPEAGQPADQLRLEQRVPLLRTKIFIPPLRASRVARPRLLEVINRNLDKPLILVSAPAGFGKTVLIAEWAAQAQLPVAWLSLDGGDNDASRFFRYVIAAIKSTFANRGREVCVTSQPMLQSAPAPPVHTLLVALINDLTEISQSFVLVLDDYQFISNQSVQEAVAFLLEHCPGTCHLLIATRSDPPLPLARLRASSRLVELRAADLSFDEMEAALFLNSVMGLSLDAEAVARLETRTEGWIAGLQMAGLSLRDREDVSGFIDGFSGSNRFILDYLLEEVLANQPPDIQRFLLYTSILGRLTAPLCDAVLGADGRQQEGGDGSEVTQSLSSCSSASTLEYLDNANLFLVPLDDERSWYRYHHLFADLLRSQLQKSLGARAVARLHTRAADWHAQNSLTLEAIQHASAAGDDQRVEQYIEQNYREMVSRGEMSGMRVWTDRLDKELVRNRPWLCIYEAYSHSWFGELDVADRLLAEAEKHLQDHSAVPDAISMKGQIAYIKSRVTAMRGDLPKAIGYCLEARQFVSPDNLALQLDTLITLGYEYFLAGDYVQAVPVLQKTIETGITTGAVLNTVAASCLLARLYAVQGLLRQADEVYQRAGQSIPVVSGQHLGARALVEIGLAEQQYERNDLAAAQAHLQQGLAWMPMWDKADDWTLAYILLARLHLALANENDAVEAVESAERYIQTRGVFSEARRAVEVARVKLWLAEGALQAASRWATSQEESLSEEDSNGFENELANIVRARVYLAEKKLDLALRLLPDLEAAARSAGRMGRVMEVLLLKALALRAAGEAQPAYQALESCLALAEPEGYTRLFLDEGGAARELLAAWLDRAGSHPQRAYAAWLHASFPTEAHPSASVQGKNDVAASPVDSLSPRELEVLQFIAQGLTNKEIASRLFVAPGTVKAHTSSIYRKLEVTNRTEAAARARQLSLLP